MNRYLIINIYFSRLESIPMSDDKLETSVPSSSNDDDDTLVTDPSTSFPSPSIQMTSSSSSSISPVKSSSIRRTFNICDILAKPSSSFIDSHQIHQLKFLIEQQSHSDDDSISDCDRSGKSQTKQ
jgi:hypothetical protein